MGQIDKIIIGVTVGVAVGIVLSCCAFFAVRFCRKRAPPSLSSRELNTASLPIRTNGIDSSIDSSASLSTLGTDTGPHVPNRSNYWGQRKNQEKDLFSSLSGVPRYLYKDIQKATQNFTTVLGQGSFGPVYKAIMPAGGVVAVKVLANKSKQGEKEFQTEVVLLSRLHHRNLVNLLGYCVDKGQLILVYEFMSNGSLANLLYGAGPRVLNWEDRLQIALDVSHGIEYLHDGASPSVVHRDLKSANILLDRLMRAKVADFGLSKEEMFDGRKSGLKGTYGYMDPSYMSTNKFTKQSDVYSFGIILFELITAINPQQGLLEYINLAVIGGGDGRAEWDEIVDKKLMGNSNTEEIRLLANIAHRCLHQNPSRRPAISDVTQDISRIRQHHVTREHTMSISESDPSSVVFNRIALQQVELSSLANIKEFPSHRE